MHKKALKRYMDRHKLNQSELARVLDKDRHQVSRWMNGQVPSGDNLRYISKALGIPMRELL